MRIPTRMLPLLAALLLSAPALARGIEISTAPPEPIYEVDPGSRAGYVVAPGYWFWDGKRHVWKPSRWIEAREGYEWVPDRWEQRGDKWALEPGHWRLAEGYEEIIDPPPSPKDQVLLDIMRKDANSSADEAAQKPVATAAKSKKKLKKRSKKINYNDETKYPRYRRTSH